MRAMERQARQTDRAIERLAVTTDLVGGQKQTRQLDSINRGYRTFGRTVDDTGSRVRRLDRDLDQHTSRWQKLKSTVTEVGAAIAGAGRILTVLRLPAMAAGIGVLVQAVGALGGGIVGLLPRLTDLVGVTAALPATLTGMGLAMITVKLATSNLTQALHGNAAAMKRLDPQARQFLQTLKSYHPVMQQLRSSAQGGLFAGLDRALPTLTRGLPVANALLRTMSRTLGGLAVQASQRFTTPGFLQDILGIGRQGASIVGRGGTSILNMISGLRNLAVAAEPFTNWLSKMVLRFTVWFERWSQFQRDSGRFASFLGRTRTALTQFGHIISNIWGFFTGLLRAARPLSNLLWGSVERGTRAWSRYANSVRGQVTLTRDFIRMYPAIHAMVTLFDNVVKAVFQMGTSSALPKVINLLGLILPDLQKMLNMLVATFGPQLAMLLGQAVQMLTYLTAQTGPLNIMLVLLTNVLHVINVLVGAVPGLGHVLGVAFSVVAIGLFIGKLRGIVGVWGLVADSANVAAAAEARALALAGGAGAAGVAGGALAGGVGATALRAGETATAGGVILPAGVEGGAVAGGTGLLARAGLRGGGLLGRAGAIASKFALPITAALGAYGALTAGRSGSVGHQAFQTLAGATNAVTGGLTGWLSNKIRPGSWANATGTPGQLAQMSLGQSQTAMQAQLGRHGGDSPRTYGQVAAQVRILTMYTRAYGQQSDASYKQAAQGLHQQLRGLQAVKRQMDAMRAQQSRAGADRTLRQEGQAFDIYAKRYGPAEATRRTTQDVLKEMGKLRDPGRRILAQQYSSWLHAESQRNPALVGQYRTLKDQITGEFKRLGTNIRFVHGTIVEGTATSWKAIAKAMTTPAERAREQVTKDFTFIQQKALAALEGMGLSAGQARKVVSGSASLKMFRGGGMELLTGPGGTVGPGSFDFAPPSMRGGGRGPRGGPKNNILTGPRGGGLHQGIIRVGDAVLNRYPGLSVTSTVRPGDTGSYHSIGEAVDISGSPGVMSAASSWIKTHLGSQLLEGIHNSGLSIKNGANVPPSFWGATTWAAHANHIHLAAGNQALGAGARGPAHSRGATGQTRTHRLTPNYLMPHRAGMGGIAGTLADQAGLLFATATASHVNAQMAGRGRGRGAGPPQVSGSGSPAANQRLAYKMMLQRWGASQWSPLHSLWMGESGFSATARNASSGAYGIPQALPPSKMGRAAAGGDARAQIAWGLNYIGGRYGSPANAYREWLSRSPHWYHDGGSGVYRRPTMIGVGDNPRGERVTVTPLGSSTAGHGGGVTLQVNVDKIEHHGEGDTRKIIYQEFEALARQLEQQPVVGDEDVTH